MVGLEAIRYSFNMSEHIELAGRMRRVNNEPIFRPSGSPNPRMNFDSTL